MSVPMVSVAMITYNQEKYIKESILGVLNQRADFEIELIIADDRSPDATEEVVKEIIANHPNGHWIKYSRHAENKGMMDNFIWALDTCSGKYTAVCEGDDYWIDPLKLQKQVKALEQHAAYSFCFHQGIRLNEVESKYDVYPLTDLTSFDPVSFFRMITIPMASVVFRKNISLKFMRDHSHPDFQLLCTLMSVGNAVFIPEVMSVYRVHPGGVSYNHSSLFYVNKRLNELEFELQNNAFSIAVRNQIARNYMQHVLYKFDTYKKEISRKEILRYLVQFIKVKGPDTDFRHFFSRLLKHLIT
ncbi:glycosyltransferase family 2 protein [Lacibacter sp.]|uniref:glycosyltransferase family 2 protein n=1 Tax=Lacibacter sp. TaxID=1915409 RepID=UPI002B4B890E|nr:glycosyltransferase [Lacibacter sp.]HLP36098.1 glycosyltransferase [Lacibacter sp.]